MIKRIITTALMIAWMVVIFMYSAKTAPESTADSIGFGMYLGHTFVSGFDDWTEEEQHEFAENIEHVVRKTAHALEYAALGILTMICLWAFGMRIKFRWWIAWIIGTGYAASDEIHQLFVPGRSGQVSDVMIDSAGVLFGIALTVLVILIYRKIRKK